MVERAVVDGIVGWRGRMRSAAEKTGVMVELDWIHVNPKDAGDPRHRDVRVRLGGTGWDLFREVEASLGATCRSKP
jgi:hypothetical protein